MSFTKILLEGEHKLISTASLTWCWLRTIKLNLAKKIVTVTLVALIFPSDASALSGSVMQELLGDNPKINAQVANLSDFLESGIVNKATTLVKTPTSAVGVSVLLNSYEMVCSAWVIAMRTERDKHLGSLARDSSGILTAYVQKMSDLIAAVAGACAKEKKQASPVVETRDVVTEPTSQCSEQAEPDLCMKKYEELIDAVQEHAIYVSRHGSLRVLSDKYQQIDNARNKLIAKRGDPSTSTYESLSSEIGALARNMRKVSVSLKKLRGLEEALRIAGRAHIACRKKYADSQGFKRRFNNQENLIAQPLEIESIRHLSTKIQSTFFDLAANDFSWQVFGLNDGQVMTDFVTPLFEKPRSTQMSGKGYDSIQWLAKNDSSTTNLTENRTFKEQAKPIAKVSVNLKPDEKVDDGGRVYYVFSDEQIRAVQYYRPKHYLPACSACEKIANKINESTDAHMEDSKKIRKKMASYNHLIRGNNKSQSLAITLLSELCSEIGNYYQWREEVNKLKRDLAVCEIQYCDISPFMPGVGISYPALPDLSATSCQRCGMPLHYYGRGEGDELIHRQKKLFFAAKELSEKQQQLSNKNLSVEEREQLSRGMEYWINRLERERVKTRNQAIVTHNRKKELEVCVAQKRCAEDDRTDDYDISRGDEIEVELLQAISRGGNNPLNPDDPSGNGETVGTVSSGVSGQTLSLGCAAANAGSFSASAPANTNFFNQINTTFNVGDTITVNATGTPLGVGVDIFPDPPASGFQTLLVVNGANGTHTTVVANGGGHLLDITLAGGSSGSAFLSFSCMPAP